MVQILGFKEEFNRIKLNMKNEVNLLEKNGIVPHLVVFLIGNNGASEVYVKNKSKSCNEIGVNITVIRLPEDIDCCALIDKINYYNNDKFCDGILVQLPLPKHIDINTVVFNINPAKDVDCFTPYRLGKLCFLQPEDLIPPTPNAVIYVMDFIGIELRGKHVVIINDTILLGKPLTQLLLNMGATVTVCNIYTTDIETICRSADVIVTGVGKPDFILDNRFCRKGVAVIDVGIKEINGKVVGDVNIDDVDNASVVTKVPGGVGLLTISFLLQNIIKIAKLRLGHTIIEYGQMQNM